MFSYVRGLFTAANLAFYYRGVAERNYASPGQMRDALTQAVTGTLPAIMDEDPQDRIAA